MPALYQWTGNIDNLKNRLSLISPEIVQMILVLKKTNISSNWRYFRLRWFLIFQYNYNRLMSLSDITVTSLERHGVSTHWHIACLFNSLFILTTRQYQRAALRVDYLTKASNVEI